MRLECKKQFCMLGVWSSSSVVLGFGELGFIPSHYLFTSAATP
ncbi:uncharacterized protein G2W53_006239 [Senna tora]|uniref:Uncharacterized protein n=1 Tax=Senna tora TaxID=362788 RepID=A0A834X3N7_9FABA|nr:uncharacterized protein G2W53_006239 [Senna tora]